MDEGGKLGLSYNASMTPQSQLTIQHTLNQSVRQMKVIDNWSLQISLSVNKSHYSNSIVWLSSLVSATGHHSLNMFSQR